MKVEELRKIKNELLKDDCANVTKLEMVYHLDDFDGFQELSEELQEKFIDFAYSYWIELDSIEHTLWDYLEALIHSTQYIGVDIISNLEDIDYQKFVDLVEEKALL